MATGTGNRFEVRPDLNFPWGFLVWDRQLDRPTTAKDRDRDVVVRAAEMLEQSGKAA